MGFSGVYGGLGQVGVLGECQQDGSIVLVKMQDFLQNYLIFDDMKVFFHRSFCVTKAFKFRTAGKYNLPPSFFIILFMCFALFSYVFQINFHKFSTTYQQFLSINTQFLKIIFFWMTTSSVNKTKKREQIFICSLLFCYSAQWLGSMAFHIIFYLCRLSVLSPLLCVCCRTYNWRLQKLGCPLFRGYYSTLLSICQYY